MALYNFVSNAKPRGYLFAHTLSFGTYQTQVVSYLQVCHSKKHFDKHNCLVLKSPEVNQFKKDRCYVMAISRLLGRALRCDKNPAPFLKI